jgi:transposase-like protein
MECPACHRKANLTGLITVAFSNRYTCPRCQQQSITDSKVEWAVYGALLAVGWGADRVLDRWQVEASAGVAIAVLLAAAVALSIEHFFQELTLVEKS